VLGIRVTASFGDAAATVAGNRAGLHRLFLVLVDNALKFSREGGEVVVTVARDDARVSVTVEDFGAGIADAELPKIFRRFYRSDGGGHGLGLALAESIARAHRAEIEVRSEGGVGSKFTVYFAVPASKGAEKGGRPLYPRPLSNTR